MSDASVRDLARRAGLAVSWIDSGSRRRHVGVATLRHILAALGLPCATAGQLRDNFERLNQQRASARLLTATAGMRLALPFVYQDTTAELIYEDGVRESLRLDAGRLPALDRPGYHRLRLGEREQPIAIAPRRCLTVGDLVRDRRPWGVAVQLYGLRRDGDGGIGDTTALADLAKSAARHGADAVALSPTHSLFPEDPARFGPYSPSSRLFLNPLLADPATVLGIERVDKATTETAAETAAETADGLIDWPTSSNAKYRLLRHLFEDFAQNDLRQGSSLAHEFQHFVQDGGESLRRHAEFEAARAQQPTSPQFPLFLQWLAAGAFAAAQKTCRDAGMRIGLISDLAVGLDPAGSDVAARPQDYLAGLRIGAPPDLFNPRGQDWGLTTFSPEALHAQGFTPFLATLRAALRHAGGVRIDHAMGLMRLWLVPDGASPTEGAYLTYPLDDLLRLVALESHRHGAIVIGEDLGTVPEGFRETMQDFGIWSYLVMMFERDDAGHFRNVDHYRPNALVTLNTHDLSTYAGWRSFGDLKMKRSLGLDPGENDQARWDALGRLDEILRQNGIRANDLYSVLAFLSRTPSRLLAVSLEDLLGVVDQPNIPGTIDEHPNWRQRLPVALDKIVSRIDFAALKAATRERSLPGGN